MQTPYQHISLYPQDSKLMINGLNSGQQLAELWGGTIEYTTTSYCVVWYQVQQVHEPVFYLAVRLSDTERVNKIHQDRQPTIKIASPCQNYTCPTKLL